MLSTEKKRYTYKDYQELPEGAPYQLINGDLLKTPAPNPYHQFISSRLEWELMKLKEKVQGEVLHAPIDVYLSETETYQPDILFISKDRLGIIGEQRIEGAPDLIVEILSPSTAYYDLKAKMRVMSHPESGSTGLSIRWNRASRYTRIRNDPFTSPIKPSCKRSPGKARFLRSYSAS